MYSMDEKLQVAEWYHRLKAETNERFFPLFFDESRYLVLKGGGGSGKSIFAGRKVLERCVSEPGHRWLVVRKVARTLRESCFEQLKNQAQAHYAEAVDFIPHGKGGDLYLRFKNGSEILFAGLDDVEKLKSIYDITGIWIEEASELKESDFQQLDIRLRGDFPLQTYQKGFGRLAGAACQNSIVLYHHYRTLLRLSTTCRGWKNQYH